MIQIRPSNEDDEQIIAGYQVSMAKETESVDLDKSVVIKGVKAVLNDPSKGKYYVAIDDNEIVASLLITPEWSDWRNSWVAWIQSVYVVPEYRGKGVFKMMYNYILQMIKNDDNYAGIRLYVDLENKSAREVYAKLGMNGDHYQLFEQMK